MTRRRLLRSAVGLAFMLTGVTEAAAHAPPEADASVAVLDGTPRAAISDLMIVPFDHIYGF